MRAEAALREQRKERQASEACCKQGNKLSTYGGGEELSFVLSPIGMQVAWQSGWPGQGRYPKGRRRRLRGLRFS